MNPRYLAYCKAHGRQPAAQIAHDAKAWPGGCTAGFQLWISKTIRTWRVARNRPSRDDIMLDVCHTDFTTWLFADGQQITIPESC